MKVIVSSCLLGKNCKYNGLNNYKEDLVTYLKDFEIVEICPEQLGGLSTPRLPSEIIDKKVIRKDGVDITPFFRKGAEISLEIAIENGCQYAVLKKNSPSCGCGQIYDGTFSSKLVEGNGITSELFLQNNIKICNEDNYLEKLKK